MTRATDQSPSGNIAASSGSAMDNLLARSWWMLALRGAIAVLFGILALMWPGITLLWLVVLFAAYALLSGVVSVAGAVTNRKIDKQWWMILLLGLIGIVAAIFAVIYPGLTALALVLVMGANAVVTGVLDIGVAVRLRKTKRNEWLLILTGVISVAFGVLVLLFPGAGALALVWLTSTYAIFTGILLLALAFRAQVWAKKSTVSPSFSGGQPMTEGSAATGPAAMGKH
jgi:uncharacterized membrane protein HdeD (DUF308 family)